jgi:hypothetical protein
MKKITLSLVFGFGMVGLYLVFWHTSIYKFDWKYGKSRIKHLNIYFISNPPNNEFDELNLIVGHLKTLSLDEYMSRSHFGIAYMKETFQTNRFYRDDYWDSDDGWTYQYNLNRINYCFVVSSFRKQKFSQCTNIKFSKFIPLIDSSSIAKDFLFDEYYNFYFIEGLSKSSKKNWLRIYYKDNKVVRCDTNYVPAEVLHIKNTGKWKNLKR